MAHDRSGIAVCISLLRMLFVASHVAAQSDTAVPSTEQQKAEREYAETLGRVRHGDMSVDFRAFRVTGALKSGPHASKLEAEERAAFRNIMASGDWTGALDSAKRALDRNYASPIAQYDAMAAYQALGRTNEAAAHEKILSALLDSIRQSGDGKSPETAYFVVTVQEEYIFLNRVLHVRATSQNWVRKDNHLYDRLLVPDLSTNQSTYLWFNADFDAPTIGAGKDGVLATVTVIPPLGTSPATRGAASTLPQTASSVPSQPDAAFGHPNLSPGRSAVQTTPAAIDPSQGKGSAANPPARSRISYAVLTKRFQPEYTPEARAAGLQGSVVLYLEVGPTGEVGKVQLIQGLGLGLDEKAMEAVKQWRFKPGTIDGRPVRVAQSVETSFLLSPAASWQIRRSAYRINRSGVDQVRRLSQPALNQYVSPASEACASDSGVVIVNLQVTKKGYPDQVRLVEAHGKSLGDAALKAISSWRFQPGLLNGKAREASGTVEMECRAGSKVRCLFLLRWTHLATPSTCLCSKCWARAWTRRPWKRLTSGVSSLAPRTASP